MASTQAALCATFLRDLRRWAGDPFRTTTRLPGAALWTSLAHEALAHAHASDRNAAPPDPRLAAHVSALPTPGPRETLAIEDKDRAAYWLQGSEDYLLRILGTLQADPAWQRDHRTPSEHATALKQAFDPLAMRGWAPAVSLPRWEAALPCMYATMKSKCWSDHTHTLVRNQARASGAFAHGPHTPLQASLRRTGRAIRLCLLHLRIGYATVSLKTAVADLRSLPPPRTQLLPLRPPPLRHLRRRRGRPTHHRPWMTSSSSARPPAVHSGTLPSGAVRDPGQADGHVPLGSTWSCGQGHAWSTWPVRSRRRAG